MVTRKPRCVSSYCREEHHERGMFDALNALSLGVLVSGQ